MKTWILALCCVFGSVSANIYDFNGDVYAGFLWWESCRTDVELAGLSPGYNPGWRVGARVAQDCWDLGVRYTGYHASKKSEFEIDQIGLDSDLGYKIDWHVVDIELGTPYSFCCNKALIRPFVGAKLAFIDEELTATNLFGETEFDRQTIDYNGYGLYAGLEGKYQFYQVNIWNACLPFSLVGRGSIGVLRGDFRRGFDLPGIDESSFLDGCFYTGVTEVFAGLEVGGSEMGCVTPYLQVGYEAQLWHMPTFFFLNSAILGFSGLTLHVGVGF